MARGLHVFDMDGTLLRSASTVELARHLGRLEQGLDIEARWLAGTISDDKFWETLLEICASAAPADIEAAFLGSPWMEGIEETFADIAARGEHAIVISQSPAFFVRLLTRWGAHETYGSAVEIGRPLPRSATLSAAAKVSITEKALGRLNLTVDDCVAYGDSSSDIELFGWLPHTVAVNAAPRLGALAAAHYVGTDLRAAYALGRRLLAGPAGATVAEDMRPTVIEARVPTPMEGN